MKPSAVNTLVVLFIMLAYYGNAQQKDLAPLFQKEEPLATKISFSIKDVKKITNDTVYTPSVLSFKKDDGSWDSIKVEIRARGNFRRANCFFPPIRVKIKKKDGEGNVFEGSKSLKLVVPCQTSSSASDLILKEYLCYQLYEPITPYYFNTRLLDLTINDTSGKKVKTYTVKAFFIEDDDVVAKRFDGKIMDDVQLHPLRLQDTTSTIHDFFEYMIANTDWSSVAQHNIKVMQLSNQAYIPLTYDFDMSGMVNAPYATVSELLAISSVRERVYRGFCRDEAIFQYTRQQFLKKESEIMKAASSVKGIDAKDVAGIQKYLGEFFDVLKDNKSFNDNVFSKCRTK